MSKNVFLDPVHTGPDPYGYHINLKSLKTSMTLEFVIILQNLIKAYHGKSGKSKYDRKLAELDVENTRIRSRVNGVLKVHVLNPRLTRVTSVIKLLNIKIDSVSFKDVGNLVLTSQILFRIYNKLAFFIQHTLYSLRAVTNLLQNCCKSLLSRWNVILYISISV